MCSNDKFNDEVNLSLLGLIGPGFWDIKSPNPIQFKNDHLTRATLGLKFNPNKKLIKNKKLQMYNESPYA